MKTLVTVAFDPTGLPEVLEAIHKASGPGEKRK